MPGSQLQRIHNQVGAVRDERLRVRWWPARVPERQLLPAAARVDILHPGVKAMRQADHGVAPVAHTPVEAQLKMLPALEKAGGGPEL